MKKILFFYIAALSSTWSTAQDWSTKLYVEDFPYVQVFDTSIRYVRANIVIGEPYKFYSVQVIYLLPNGNTLNLNLYRDSLIYASELDTSGFLVQGGEMKIDYAQAISKQYECSDQNGEDSTCYQIYYPLVKHGGWTKAIDLVDFYFSSNYSNGKFVKKEMFFDLIKEREKCLIIPDSLYTYNYQTNEYSFKLGETNQSKKLIKGHYYLKTNHFVFFRNKIDRGPSIGIFESFFDSTGNYRGKRRLSCGTGATEQDFRPTSTWELTHDNKLIFLDQTWTILYLDEEIMILKYEE